MNRARVSIDQRSCKAHAKINRKMRHSTPCKIVIPKHFNLKLCVRDYVREATHYAKFGSNRHSEGFSPYRRNITTLWLLLTVLSCIFSQEHAQIEPLNRFSRFMAQTTCFRVRKCFWESGRWEGESLLAKWTNKLNRYKSVQWQATSEDKCPSMLAAHNMITINIICNIMTEKKNKKREKNIYIK